MTVHADRAGAPVWEIGSLEGFGADLVDDVLAPAAGEVVWRTAAPTAPWPAYHPSEADPAAGYRQQPRRIVFELEHAPERACLLTIDYLVLYPRLPSLELRIGGAVARVHLHPTTSTSGEALLHASLHTAIDATGRAEVVIPRRLLGRGENVLELVCCDDGAVLRVDDPAAVERLDRMANGAGVVYRRLRLEHVDAGRHPVRATLTPTAVHDLDPTGELRSRCHLDLELPDGTPATTLGLRLTEGDRDELLVLEVPAIAFGHHRATFDLFDGTGPVSYQVTGSVAGRELGASGTIRRRRKWTVYVAAHAHTDVGYTHRQWEVAERAAWNVDTLLDRLDRDAEPFAYHLDAAWALEAFLATRDERARARLIAAIRSGRLGVAATYAGLLTHAAALEDLIRNLEPTDALLAPHGLRAELATAVDVASLSSALPDVLAGAGVPYLVHAGNQDRGPLRLNGGLHRRSPFRWRGPAGGSVLVWMSRMYCELRKVCGSPPTLDSAERGLDLWLSKFDRDDYAPDAVLLYGQEADNTDLDPHPADFVRRWNAAHAYPRLVPADPAAFMRHVEERFGAALPTVQGDGGAYWEDGVGSAAAETARARAAQATLPAAERVTALAVVHGSDQAFPSAPTCLLFPSLPSKS